MDGDTSWLGRRLAAAGAAVLAVGALACAAPACADESATASGESAQQVEQAAAQGTQIADMSSVDVSSADSESVRPDDAPEGDNPRPGMDSVGAPEKRPGAQEGEELAAAVKVAPECDADQDSVTLWVWAASMNVDPQITIRQLNAWRAQAAQRGVTDAQGEAIQGEALTWSDSLAYAAQELAVEIALGGGDTSSLERLNGSGSITAGAGNTFFTKTNIVGVSVTTSLTSVQGALDAWYVESEAYWAGPSSTVYHTTGDYANAVSNKARAVGMAAVMLSNEEVYIVCVYGDAVPEEVGDTTYELTTGSAVYQGVNVRRDYLSLVLDVPETCTAGQEVPLGLRASTTLAGNAVAKDMGVAIDSQAILDGATVQVVQGGQVVGEVRDGVLQADEGFTSGEATVEVVVEGAVLASAQTELVAVPENVQAEAAFDVSVPSGGAVELPATAQVVWSGGAVSDEPVTWDALTPEQEAVVASREGGTFEVGGVVEATGETVSSTVTVEPATMVSAETPTAEAVWVGGAPALPETVAVTWSNGDITDEPVAWQTPDTSQAGTVQAVGTVEGLDQQVVADVEVRALEVAGVDASQVASVEVASGATEAEALSELPQTVPVTWSDGSVSDEAVAWDALTAEQRDTLASREGGTVEVQGEVGDTGQSVTATVEVQPAQVASVETPAQSEAWQGADPELPAEVSVGWTNGDETSEPVAWEVADTSEPGTVEVQGSVGDTGQTVTATVQVKALEAVEVNGSADVRASVTSGATEADALAALPQTVPVSWSDGSVSDEPVTWDALTAEQQATVASRAGGTVEVQGEVGDTGQSVTAAVEVQPAQVASVGELKPVTVEVGQVPKLPSQITVTWSNGDVTVEPVTWEDADTSKAGSYEVKGELADTGASVTATVEVESDEQPASPAATTDPSDTSGASSATQGPAAPSSNAADDIASTPASSQPAAASDTQEASEQVGGLPGWLIATIAGIGAALVAAGAFIVGKKYNAKDDEPVGKHAAK